MPKSLSRTYLISALLIEIDTRFVRKSLKMKTELYDFQINHSNSCLSFQCFKRPLPFFCFTILPHNFFYLDLELTFSQPIYQFSNEYMPRIEMCVSLILKYSHLYGNLITGVNLIQYPHSIAANSVLCKNCVQTEKFGHDQASRLATCSQVIEVQTSWG